MTDTLLVLLVSDQTIPNVQFLKWFFTNRLQTVGVLFISTQKMETNNKSECTLNAVANLGKWISNKETITVDENSIDDIQTKISQVIEKIKPKKIVVNITCGTKMMSLATYNYFKAKSNCEIYYQPITSSLQKIYPTNETYANPEITIEEYMKAHGIEFKPDNTCVMNYDYNKDVYEKIIKDNHEKIKPIVSMQNNSYFKNIFKRKDSIDFTQIPDEKFVTEKGSKTNKEEVLEVIKNFGFDITKISHSQLKYITGGWFEEYVYQKIKTEQKLGDDKIALNVSINKNNDKNELDIVYIDSKNKLHVIECKSFIDEKKDATLLKDTIYKAQAIKTKFGLNVASAIYTKSKITKDSALNKANDFGITIITGATL